MYRAARGSPSTRRPARRQRGDRQAAQAAEIEVGDDAVAVNGHDVTSPSATPEVNAAVTPVAANSAVRAELSAASGNGSTPPWVA